MSVSNAFFMKWSDERSSILELVIIKVNRKIKEDVHYFNLFDFLWHQ